MPRIRVLKWTWLLDNVEVTGVVAAADPAEPDGTIAGDNFNVVLDSNHTHMVATNPGSRGVLHCETYRENFDNPSYINRAVPWKWSPSKTLGQKFVVRDPATNTWRNLVVGDHIRLLGRWIIENGHPWGGGGFLVYYGYVFMELHPFDWTTMKLVRPSPAHGATVEQLSLAAPIYEQVYPESWWWNRISAIGDTIAFRNGAANYHATMSVDARIKAPTLPAGFTASSSLVSYEEDVQALGTGLVLDDVRSVVAEKDGIRVYASVTAAADMEQGTIEGPLYVLANYTDPAQGRSIFQAKYRVFWKPRLVPKVAEVNVAASIGATAPFSITLENVGPDPLTILELLLGPPLQTDFEVDTPTTTMVPAFGSVAVTGRFKPQPAGSGKAILMVRTNDPSERHPTIALRGTAYAPAGVHPSDFSLPATLSEHVLRAVEYKLDATPSPLAFPETEVGATSVLIVSVLNPFPTPISVRAAIGQPSVFGLAGPTVFQVGAQASQSVSVTFEPTASGSYTGALTVTEAGNAQNQRVVQLTGSAI